jgi:hypothetical protein
MNTGPPQSARAKLVFLGTWKEERHKLTLELRTFASLVVAKEPSTRLRICHLRSSVRLASTFYGSIRIERQCVVYHCYRNRAERRRSLYPERLLTIPSLSSPRTLRFRPLQRPEYGRILEPAWAAWRERLDYTQQPLASSANRRATGRPPGVASASPCFPDADPTMTQRDKPLHSQVRARVLKECAPRHPISASRIGITHPLSQELKENLRCFGSGRSEIPSNRSKGASSTSLVSVCEFSCVIGAPRELLARLLFPRMETSFSAWIIQNDVFT